MPRFIVLPKRSAAAATASFTMSAVTPESRVARVATLRDAHAGGQKELFAFVKNTKAAKLVNAGSSSNPLGVAVVTLEDDATAELLRIELPDRVVLADRPLDLIPPKKLTETHKAKPSSPDLWHLTAIGLVKMRKAGFKGTGVGVQVAVFDTGVDAKHPELAGSRVLAGYRYVGTDQLDAVTPPTDSDGHGTHVAGLICGKTVGVAPAAQVVSIEMIPGGHGMLSNFVLSLQWAVENLPTVRILNMSAGIPGFLPEMRAAVDDLLAVGILPVIATGNEGRDRTRSPGNYKEVLSVGAAEKLSSDKYGVPGFSSGGRLEVENQIHIVPQLVAPGKAVYSAVVGGGYEAWNGTSMATPIVSGVAALVVERYPDIPVIDLIDLLVTHARDLGLSAERQGGGLVQVPPL